VASTAYASSDTHNDELNENVDEDGHEANMENFFMYLKHNKIHILLPMKLIAKLLGYSKNTQLQVLSQ
jgi:hypothetical protein